jgi:hypothetical protein
VAEQLNNQGFMAQDPDAKFFLQVNNDSDDTGGVTSTPVNDECGDMLTPEALEADNIIVLDKYLITDEGPVSSDGVG